MSGKLLDLRFLEGDVLARHRIVLLELELLGRGARVLLGHVVVAGVSRAHQLDQDRVSLGHFSELVSANRGKKGRRTIATERAKSSPKGPFRCPARRLARAAGP